MKKVILNSILFLVAFQLNAQNEEIHQGKIIGTFDLGTFEISIVFDEITLCERKTSPHAKNLFSTNESVLIKINDNDQLAEVVKTNLSEQVYANKYCEDPEIIEDLIFNVEDESLS